MSKLSIILCTVLLASADNDIGELDPLRHPVQRVEDILEATIGKLKTDIAATLQRTDEIDVRTAGLVQNATERLSREMIEIVQKAENGIKELINRANGAEAFKCHIHAVNLDRTRILMNRKMRTCTWEMVDLGVLNSKKISRLTAAALQDLDDLWAEIHHCNNKVAPAVFLTAKNPVVQLPQIQAGYPDLACRAQVELKSATIIKSYFTQITVLNNVFKSLETPFDTCTRNINYHKFVFESSTIMNRVRACINVYNSQGSAIITS